MNPLAQALKLAVNAAVPPGVKLCVAYSGGRDSTALLHAAATCLRTEGYDLGAIHVHHGLSIHANAWAEHCAAVAKQWGIDFQAVHVTVQAGKLGIEAAARAARYKALAQADAAAVLLAHHEDDQAETVLVQLLRGGGVAGLAGMPAVFHKDTMRFLRPWLGATRLTIAMYAAEHRLTWVEDESNTDPRFTRNYLRAEVLPALGRHNPAASRTLARSARHLADAAALLDELAASDRAAALQADGALNLTTVAQLSPARQRNLLRGWLASVAVPAPSDAWLANALSQLLTARDDASVELPLADSDIAIQRYRKRAYVVAEGRPAWHAPLVWHGEDRADLGAAGVVTFSQTHSVGLRPPVRGELWEFRQRQGGERLRLAANRHARPLKLLYQDLGIPPWLRQGAPLLYCNNQLAWAAHIGVDAAFTVTGGLSPEWQPCPPAFKRAQ